LLFAVHEEINITISLFDPIEIEPRPIKPAFDAAQQIATRAITSHAVAPVIVDRPLVGHKKSEVLLQAIRIVAKKEPTFVK
jgi:hypothetical protein